MNGRELIRRKDLDEAALAYLEYLCDRVGGVPSEVRCIPRGDVRRDLGIDESDVVGYLAACGYVDNDTGQVWLMPKGLDHLDSLGRCRDQKGVPGRPSRREIDAAAERFLEALYDRVEGLPDPNRDVEIGELARAAGIEHADDVDYVALEYLRDRLGYVGSSALSRLHLTETGAAFVERRRHGRGGNRS